MENIKYTPFNDPLIESKLQEVRKYPELIRKITEWKSVSLCYYCLNELPNNHDALTPTYLGNRRKDLILRYGCPHCSSNGDIFKLDNGWDGKKYAGGSYEYKLGRLPHYVVRKRDIITGYEKSWFSKKPIFFTETQLILDNSK